MRPRTVELAAGSALPLDLRKRCGGKRTERVVGEWVDGADVDLAKNVGIRAVGTLLPIEEIGIPQDRQLRLL